MNGERVEMPWALLLAEGRRRGLPWEASLEELLRSKAAGILTEGETEVYVAEALAEDEARLVAWNAKAVSS